MKNFLKLAALLLSLALVLGLVGCGTYDEDDTLDAPDTVDQQNSDDEPKEPEKPKEEPPIEISEFSEPEDMPKATESGEYPPEFTADDYAINVDGRSFTLQWLYEQNIHDWFQAGITFEMIEGMTGKYLDLPLTADAIEALKQKISDFTMLTYLEVGTVTPPSITVDEAVYDLEWLSSHNATQYTEAGISADIVSQYLDMITDDFGYTPEYRWIKEVYNRLVNGWD